MDTRMEETHNFIELTPEQEQEGLRLEKFLAESLPDYSRSFLQQLIAGGMVSVKLSGKRELTSITIDPQVVDPDDIEMLQDLIMAAVNEALRKGEEAREAAMSRMAPGMGGLF